MSLQTISMTPSLYQYLQQHSLREPKVLQELRARTEKQFPEARHMQISPEQGQFMRLLIQLMQAKRIIEIGVFTGYSALSMALALPDDGQLIACDIKDEFSGLARHYWEQAGVSNKIDFRVAPALDTLQQLQAGHANSIDLIFIDADKENYLNYYELSLQLLRAGGLLLVDNVLWSGAVADLTDDRPTTIALREFNQLVHQDQRVELSLLPIGDGLSLLRKL